MSASLEGKVAFVTGAARGMGRQIALTLAEEGADILALDICGQISTVPYPMSTPEDLEETVRQVEKLGRRIVAEQADVRDLEAVERVVAKGVSELGHLDIVVANAGIGIPEAGIFTWNMDPQRWNDMIGTNLTGVWHTFRAAVPPMLERDEGGSIIVISSTGGIKGNDGIADYVSSKHGVVGLMRSLAKELAPHWIRVNAVHPTGVATPMIQNAYTEKFYAELGEEAEAGHLSNMLDVSLVEPVDIANAIAWLSSDKARYITAISLPVDAGLTQK